MLKVRDKKYDDLNKYYTKLGEYNEIVSFRINP